MLAFALANVSHEALGHGLATLAVGDRAVLLTTCFFTSSGNPSRWIPAGGGLMNLAVGFAALASLRFLPRLGPLFRYFLVLVAAFNLFFAFGYPAYSGLAGFGDWAAVTAGLQPPWLWRVLLVVIAVAGYYSTMILLARPLAPFAATAGGSSVNKGQIRSNHAHSLHRSHRPRLSGGTAESRWLADHAFRRLSCRRRRIRPHPDGSPHRPLAWEESLGGQPPSSAKLPLDPAGVVVWSSLLPFWARASAFPSPPRHADSGSSRGSWYHL